MAKYVAMECENDPTCEFSGKIWSHVHTGYTEEGNRLFVCESCGFERQFGPAPSVSKKKTTWPYYHEGTGMRFESESHEQKYAKHHKLEKV